MSERVKTIINNFKGHLQEENLRKLTTQDWKSIFSKELSFVFSTRPYMLDPKYLYRARPNINDGKKVDFFEHTSDLWATPRKITTQGRCHTKGQSMLYCSTCSTTTLFEIKPDTGSEITIIEYQSLGEIGLLGVVGANEVISVGEDYKKLFGSHFENSSEEAILIDEILSGIFKLKPPAKKDFPIYNLTNALIQIFMNNQKIKALPSKLIPSKMIGLIYPSVETHKVLGVNIAMEPMSVKNVLKPIRAFKWSIIKKHDEHRYEIKLTHQTSKIWPNGEMRWGIVIDSKVEFLTDLEPHLKKHVMN